MATLDYFKWGLNFFELLSCVTGFFYWNKIKNSYWKYFPFYLLIIIIIELTGKFIEDISININLYLFFGIPIQFIFFFWLFYNEALNKIEKNWVLICTTIYFISLIVDILFLNKLKFWFSSFSYTVGNIALVILIIRRFFKFINTNEIIDYKSKMIFWVMTGLLIFYLGSLPFFGLRNTLYYRYRDVFWLYNYIQLGLDCLMYLFFAFAFIWKKQK